MYLLRSKYALNTITNGGIEQWIKKSPCPQSTSLELEREIDTKEISKYVLYCQVVMGVMMKNKLGSEIKSQRGVIWNEVDKIPNGTSKAV